MGKYSNYAEMVEGDRILEEFPGLSAEELEQANGFFRPYIFFENVKEGRKVWTSCCHHRGELWSWINRTETQRERNILGMAHNDEVECPYCHRRVKAKNVKKMGTARRLEEYVPILFLHARDNGETIYAQGYWARKTFGEEERWASPPLYMVTRVFRFRRGEWIAWSDEWVSVQKGCAMRRDERKWIREPFTDGSGMMVHYCGYKVIGLDVLGNSFLRYTGVQKMFEGEDLCSRFVSTMALAALYPEGVEMLLKAGMKEPIEDWVWNRKKNTATVKWGERDPRKVFGLNGQELKEFLAGSKDLGTLEIYKRERKRDPEISYRDMEKIVEKVGVMPLKMAMSAIKLTPGLKLRKLMRYLEGFTGPRCGGRGIFRIQEAIQEWVDYIRFAKDLGYDLTNPIIQMPKNLDLKHNEAYTAVVAIREEAKQKEMREKRRREDRSAAGRVETLEKRYGFETEHYLIRPPESATEIVEEGMALKHCVGGYAARHAEGAVTILLLRDKERADVPLVTIQMDGIKLVQAHGYRNERNPHWTNPDMIPPVKLYEEIMTPWLEWVKAGSPRDKKGQPKLPKKIKKEAHVA